MKQTESIKFVGKKTTLKPVQNFVKREYRLSDGERTFVIWLTDGEIAKGKVKQQVLMRAFRNGYIDSFATNRFVVSRVY